MLQKQLYKIDQYQENTQKRLIAVQDIEQEGTTLIEQQPQEIAVLPYMRDKICNYCLEPKDKLLKCGQCRTFYYCSQKCQKQDWTIHKKECKIYSEIKKKQFKLTSQFVLVLRLFIKNKGQTLENFITNYDKFPQKNIEFFRDSAYMTLKYLEEQVNETNVENLIKLNMQVFLNAFTLQDPLQSYEGLAIGIYNEANYLNHSCLPNCIQIQVNRTTYIKNIRPIKEGEELTISYFDTCKPKQTRKQYTKDQYFFECNCERCQKPENFFAIKCHKCKQGKLQEESLTCEKCDQKMSPETLKKIENRIKEIKIQIQTDIPYNQRVDLILEARDKVLMTDPQFCSIISNFIVFSIQKEQYRNATIFMKVYIKNFHHWYGQDLPLLFGKYNELSKLLFYENKLLKAEEYSQKALKLSLKFFRDLKFQELEELKQRYQDIKHEIMMNK